MIGEANNYLGQNRSAEDLLAEARQRNSQVQKVADPADVPTERPKVSPFDEFDREQEGAKQEEIRKIREGFEAQGYSRSAAMGLVNEVFDKRKKEAEKAAIDDLAQKAKAKEDAAKAAERADVERRNALIAQLSRPAPNVSQSPEMNKAA